MPISKWERRINVASSIANLAMVIAVIFSVTIAVRELSAIHDQIEYSRQQKGMELLWRLHDRMASDSMRANLILLGTMPNPTTVQVFTSSTAEGQVLRDMANFYEMLALSANNNYIDYEDVRGYIGVDVLEFWEGVSSAVLNLRRQAGRPSMYCELEKLSIRLSHDLGHAQEPPAILPMNRAPGENLPNQVPGS